MSAKALLTVRRETAVGAVLAGELDAIFDEGLSWDAEHGQRFFAHPDTLLLVARWNGEVCGFLSAYQLQRFDPGGRRCCSTRSASRSLSSDGEPVARSSKKRSDGRLR